MYTIQDEHMLSSMDSKTSDKHTQPILRTHMGINLPDFNQIEMLLHVMFLAVPD